MLATVRNTVQVSTRLKDTRARIRQRLIFHTRENAVTSELLTTEHFVTTDYEAQEDDLQESETYIIAKTDTH